MGKVKQWLMEMEEYVDVTKEEFLKKYPGQEDVWAKVMFDRVRGIEIVYQDLADLKEEE